jgi:hypothetical protein
MMAVLALGACSAGNGEPPSSTAVSAPEMPVEPSGLPMESSTPSPTFPTAKDGQNYAACSDGNCEVLLRSKAVITLHGKKYNATVKSGTVRLESGSGYVSLSGFGNVTWSNNGPVYNATLKAAEGDTAILILTSRG